MKKFFRRTSLLLAAAFLGAATMQVQKSPQDMDRFIDALIKRMTVEEKIGQLVKLDGFRSYERSGSEYRLNPEFTETVEKWLIGSMYGLVRADWWTERDWNSGVPPEKMNEVVNLFQKYILDHSRLGIPLYIAEEAPHGLMALGTSVVDKIQALVDAGEYPAKLF